MQTTKAEIVIQKEIIRGVYSFPQLMYRNKNRFEMILSQPNDKVAFDKVKAVFKGRYICKNDECLQDKRQGNSRNKKGKNEESDPEYEDDIHEDWMSWWKKQQDKLIKLQLHNEQETEKKSQNLQKRYKLAKNDDDQFGRAKVKKYLVDGKEVNVNGKKQKEKQNTRWSSSLSYVIMYYRSFPQPLDKLKKVYSRKTNNKCEIYFYVELLGQKCKTCDSDQFCYPFFGKTELKRIRKNFSSFIFNKIEGKPILRYKPCPLKRLKGHKPELCQACQLGQCGIKCLPCS